MRVASRVDERLKTQDLVQNNIKTSWNYNLVSSPPPKKKILSILTKDSLKIEIELLPQYTISHENQSFSQIFYPWLQYLITSLTSYIFSIVIIWSCSIFNLLISIDHNIVIFYLYSRKIISCTSSSIRFQVSWKTWIN